MVASKRETELIYWKNKGLVASIHAAIMVVWVHLRLYTCIQLDYLHAANFVCICVHAYKILSNSCRYFTFYHSTTHTHTHTNLLSNAYTDTFIFWSNQMDPNRLNWTENIAPNWTSKKHMSVWKIRIWNKKKNIVSPSTCRPFKKPFYLRIVAHTHTNTVHIDSIKRVNYPANYRSI